MEFRWDLIPFEALRAISAALTEGEIKYGRWDEDPREPNYAGLDWQTDQSPLSHALHHLAQYQRGDESEDHLAKAAANLCILLKGRDNPSSPYYGLSYPEVLGGDSSEIATNPFYKSLVHAERETA